MNYPKGEYLLKDFTMFRILRALSGFYYDRDHKVQIVLILLSRIILIYGIPGQTMIFFKINKFDINSVVEYLVPFGVCNEMLIRNIFYTWKHNEYIELSTYVKQHFWPISYMSNEKNRKYLEKKLLLLQYGSAAFLIIVLLSDLMYCFHPMAELIPGKKLLPIRVWFPFDTNPTAIHITLYSLLIYSGIIGGLWVITTDLLYIYFISHLVVQINIIRDLLKNINHVSIDDEDNDSSLIECETYQNIIYDRLKICTKHHEKLLTFQAKLQHLFNGIMLSQLFMSTCLICVVGYAFIETEELEKKLTHFAIFLSLSLELIIYCIPGSVLEHQSDELCLSIYQSKWYRGNAKFRKSFLFLQYQALYQPFTISAFGVFPINNLCLVQVFKLAFSSITMLQTLQEN